MKRAADDPEPGKEPRNDDKAYHAVQLALSLTEKDVGIELYLRKGEPLSAIFKHRYSDFIVREIDQSGRIVRLSEEEKKDEANVPKAEAKEKPQKKAEFDVDEALMPLFEALVGKQQTMLMQEWLSKFTYGAAPFTFAPLTEKDKRGAVHGLVKKIPFLFSETENGCVVVKSRKQMSAQDRTREIGAAGRYVRFALCKENKETTDAVSVLCQKLRVSASVFSWAGTKDKRGVTTQLVTAWKVEPNRLSNVTCRGLNPSLFGLKLGNIELAQTPLRLGDLNGNQFEVTLRDVQGAVPDIEAALRSISELGFVNYYGMQRFGSSAVATHTVGCAMLKEEWKSVGDAILNPRGGERPDFAHARKVWEETHNPETTLRVLPRQMYIERMLLQGLLQHGVNNYRNALSNLPRNLRMLYVHAYQSYIWNRMATKRIVKYGLTVVVGDLVAVDAKREGKDEKIDALAVLPEEAGAPKGEYDDEIAAVVNEDAEGVGGVVHNVKVIESEEEARKSSLHDVVLPLPGAGILYPTNDLRSEYATLLECDGLKASVWESLPKDLFCRGAYRRLVQRPKNTHWRLQKYAESNQQFTLTDMDVLAHKTLPSVVGPYLALVLQFELPPGTYATMLFRELLLRSGDFSSQKILSLAHKSEKEKKEKEEEKLPPPAPVVTSMQD